MRLRYPAKILMVVGLCLGSVGVFAQNVPADCKSEGVGIQDNQIIFNNNNKPGQYLFLLHNTSKGTVLMNHIKSDPGASAGWASKIESGNWSMLTVGQSQFSMSCVLYQPPVFKSVNCGSVVSVCAIPSSVAGGGYWVAENEPLDKILEKAKARGVM